MTPYKNIYPFKLRAVIGWLRGMNRKATMKNPDKEKRNEILNKPYMTMNDLYEVLPVGRQQSNKLFKQLEKKLKDEGIKLFVTTPRVIPTKYVKQEYL